MKIPRGLLAGLDQLVNNFMINSDKIISESVKLIELAKSTHELSHEIKAKVFGKNSALNEISALISKAQTKEEKVEIGKTIQAIKIKLQEFFDEKFQQLQKQEIDLKLKTQSIDATISIDLKQGRLHPITQVIDEIKDILGQLGFSYKTGYEIETDDNNFTKLNIDENHPARQMHDTFFLNSPKMLLRTHTTAVDIREMEQYGAPIGIMSCGKTFRNDSDATHSPMFHQFEGLMIDKGMNMKHLKFCLEFFLKKFFDVKEPIIRLRPSFFPFTEPSCEVDVGYSIKNNKIEIGGSEKFLEILGCGILHRNVLKNCGIDHSKFSGIAFGGGVERMAMLKYGMNDLRDFTKNEANWLNYFGF